MRRCRRSAAAVGEAHPATTLHGRGAAAGAAGSGDADSPDGREVGVGTDDDAIQTNPDPAPVVGALLCAGAAIRIPKQIPPAVAAGARVYASPHRICKPAVDAVDVQVPCLAVRGSMGRVFVVGAAESLDPADAVLPYRCLPARSSHLRA